MVHVMVNHGFTWNAMVLDGVLGMNGGDPLSRPGRHSCRPTDEWPAALGVLLQLNTLRLLFIVSPLKSNIQVFALFDVSSDK